jgi:putative SOS response-associated peptidase YedK
MCGRYSLTLPNDAMRQLFDLPAAAWMAPRFNIAPSQIAPVIRLGDIGRGGTGGTGGTDGGGGMVLDGMTWGLIPSWSKEGLTSKGQINARSETAAEKPAFRAAFRRRRCLIPADGFYEWQNVEGGKQPYWISRTDGAPFVFAGLWETRGDRHGGEIVSFAILTTAAAENIRPIHHRMPVILESRNFAAWLDPRETPPPSLFAPGQAPEMTARPVSRRVNSPRNDDAACLAEAPKSPVQGKLF